MANLVTAPMLRKGYKTNKASATSMGTFMMPPQFVPVADKDINFVMRTMDQIEYEGIRQVRYKANRLLKNYKMANGELDITDYVKTEGNYAEIVQQGLSDGGQMPGNLRYYSLMDTLVNVLCNEFANRYNNIEFTMVDPNSDNELWQAKHEQIDQVLLGRAYQKQYQKMLELGLTDEDEEGQQMLSEENLRSLPDIQKWANTTYKNELIDWATAQKQYDDKRFSMEEMERFQFRNMLITDSEYWHFRMGENDYNLEPINPILEFHRKATRNRYVSDGLWAGFFDLYTTSEVVDLFGDKMTEEQVSSLESIYPIANSSYIQDGIQNDGAMYDKSQSYQWNRQGPGLAMRQFTSMMQLTGMQGVNDTNYGGYGGTGLSGDVVYKVLSQSEDLATNYRPYLVRVSTIYWKTMRKIGRLTKKDEVGNFEQAIVSEEYKVTDKPLYDMLNYTEKTRQSLLYGEHIDWTWIPEVWGGYKIGPAMPNRLGLSDSVFAPMYIGVNGGVPGRVPFQFKGDDNIYGCKLPIEGAVFNEYNVRSRGFIERGAPYQVGYNMMMNLAMDMTMDEIGKIMIIDQGAIPKHSLGEEWGENNWMKWLTMIKDTKTAPVDTTRSNTEQPIHQNYVQVVDMSQTEMIFAKYKMADYYKFALLQTMGFSPERMAAPVDKEQTATEVNQRRDSSNALTEQYFIDHCDHLMPKVHQMRTDLAQYYACTNPSIRLQYNTSDNAKVILQMDGTRLLGRDYGVFATTKSNMRNIMQQVKQLILTDNTTDATLPDRIQVLEAENMSSIKKVLSKIEQRENGIRQSQQQMEQEQFEKEQEQMWAMHEDTQAQEMEIADKQMANERYVAEVRAAVAMGTVDLNANAQSDYMDFLKIQQGQAQAQNKMALDREKFVTDTSIQRETLNLRRQEVQASNSRTRVMAAEAGIQKKKEQKKKEQERKNKKSK
jgi:hypothetical protein